MLNNKEKSIQALIIQMMELQEDLKYETRLNVELSSKLNKQSGIHSVNKV
jgi:hypothetical protein